VRCGNCLREGPPWSISVRNMIVKPLPFSTKQVSVARIIWLALGGSGVIISWVAYTQSTPLNPSSVPLSPVSLLQLIGFIVSLIAIVVPITLRPVLEKLPDGPLVQLLIALSLAEAVAIIGFVAALQGGGFEAMEPLLLLFAVLWVFRYPKET
jgi:hypothetical protein